MSEASELTNNNGKAVSNGAASLPKASPQSETQVFSSPVEALLAPLTLPSASPPPEYTNEGAYPPPVPRNELLPHANVRTSRPNKRWLSSLDVMLFLLFFALPVGGGIYYFGLHAANQYVSEFRFNVIDTSSSTPAIAGGIASVLGGAGLGSGSTDSYTVTDFLTSPQAVTEVEKKLQLREMFAKGSTDQFFRFDAKSSVEKLNTYWSWMVSSYYDPVTGISSAQVKAFSAQDASVIANTLLASAEALVNQMQNRQRSDTIRFAQESLDRDNATLAATRKRMLALRSQSGYIEPSASGVAENIALATSLRLSIVNTEAELNGLRRMLHDNNKAPSIQALSVKLKATRDQLAGINREISTKTSHPGPLATVVGKFDDLSAEQLVATSIVASDLVNLQQARAQADAQHIYLSTYVYPTMPTISTFPNRPLAIALVALAAFGMFCFAKLVATAIRSHAV